MKSLSLNDILLASYILYVVVEGILILSREDLLLEVQLQPPPSFLGRVFFSSGPQLVTISK